MKKSPDHIVVLHGWTISPEVTRKWQPFLALLQKAGLAVHFWPLPGLTVDATESFTLDRYVSWLDTQTQKLPPFILLGHSFGGQLAIRFAARNPERVQKLILVDSSGIIDRALPKVVKRAVFRSVAAVGKQLFPSETLKKLLYRFAREKDYVQANPYQQATMRSILADEIVTDLPRVTAPTLVVWGEHDTTTPVKHALQIANGIPDAQLTLISGARHSPVYTHPEEVMKAVSAFIA